MSARGIIKAIRSGRWKARIDKIRHERDKEAARKLKQCLPGVLPSGRFTKRDIGSLVEHSGLLCADVDRLNGELQTVREKLKGSPYLWAHFVSPSGNGLKCFFRISADASKHLASYRAVEVHVKELTGVQIDEKCKDVARLCFVSFDPDAYVNENAEEIEPLPEPHKPDHVSNVEVNLSERQRVASELLGSIDWQSETEGLCLCPNQAAHTTGNEKRDCKVWLEEAPSIYCFHNSCQGIVDAVNRDLRSRIAKAEAPAKTEPGNRVEKRHYELSDLSGISAKAVDWIEEPYLARGEMHFLQGQGGSYKGTLALTWAAEFSRRGEHVLLILAEDDLATKVKPLLMAAQADMGFIHTLTIRCGENEDALVLPDDLEQLEHAMAETQAALVIIDPLLSHMSLKVDAYKDQHVKRVLTQIGKMAQRTNTVIICVHHTKKDTSAGVKMAGMGSVAFYTTARLVLAMAKLTEDEIILEVVKSNIGPEGVKQLLRAEIAEPMPGIKCPRLTRAGDSPVGVAEALSGERKEKETKTLAAARRILDILDDHGEQKQSELFDQVAEEIGLSPKTIRTKAYFGIIKPGNNGLGLVKVRRDGFQGELLVSRTDVPRPLKLQTGPSNCNLKSCTQGKGYTLGFPRDDAIKEDRLHIVYGAPNCNPLTPYGETGYSLAMPNDAAPEVSGVSVNEVGRV